MLTLFRGVIISLTLRTSLVIFIQNLASINFTRSQAHCKDKISRKLWTEFAIRENDIRTSVIHSLTNKPEIK
jgi:hypothetical protein